MRDLVARSNCCDYFLLRFYSKIFHASTILKMSRKSIFNNLHPHFCGCRKLCLMDLSANVTFLDITTRDMVGFPLFPTCFWNSLILIRSDSTIFRISISKKATCCYFVHTCVCMAIFSAKRGFI